MHPAVRNLARIGVGVVSVRWSQLGYGRTSSTSQAQQTPRNLMGFKDGTANLKAEETEALGQQLWARPGDGPSWMDGGAYLVTRKVRMMVETWDRTSLGEQETIFGRTKGEGAVFGQAAEFDLPDFKAAGPDGEPLVGPNAHIRLAHPSFNNGAKLLRRGYNFIDGSDGLGRLNAGLFFMAYQRNPHKQFVSIQRQLAAKDDLNEYIRHVSSGLFACPPGVADAGDYWGRALFALSRFNGPAALRFCLFHRLTIFFGTLGADLGTLLTFLVEYLFTAQQFDKRFVGAVAFSPCSADNSQITTLTIAKARRDRVKEFGDGFIGHQVGRCLPPSRQVALLAEGNHLLDQRADRFRLDRSRLDPFFHDQRRDHIPEQRPPVRRVPPEFVSRNLVTHKNLSCQWPIASGFMY